MVVVGDIGDPLAVRVVATFDLTDPDPSTVPDFTGHTWRAQIRTSRDAATAVAELAVAADNCVYTVAGGVVTDAVIDVTFRLDDTTVLDDGIRYVWGCGTSEGTYAPWTLIAAEPLAGCTPVARDASP